MVRKAGQLHCLLISLYRSLLVNNIKKLLTVFKLQYVNFSLGGRNGHFGGQFEVGLPHLLRAEVHSSGKGTSIPKIIQIRSQCPIVEATSGNVSFYHVYDLDQGWAIYFLSAGRFKDILGPWGHSC